MAKLTLHRLLQRLHLTALQLASDTPTSMRQQQLSDNNNNNNNNNNTNNNKNNNSNNNNNRTRMALLGWLQLCHGNGHYLTLAVLIYGYLMLHTSAAASASSTTTTTTMLAVSNLTTSTLGLSQEENAQKPKRDVAHVPDDDYDASYPDDIDDLEALINNKSGSRRPSLASVHSTSSSVRSYSMMRFEKEVQQKEIRQEMKLRLARLQQQQHLTQNKPQIIIGEALLQHGALSRVTMATPSPLTPNSLDELLPSLDENQEYPPRLENTFKQLVQPQATTMTATKAAGSGSGRANGYNGPCSSSTEAL